MNVTIYEKRVLGRKEVSVPQTRAMGQATLSLILAGTAVPTPGGPPPTLPLQSTQRSVQGSGVRGLLPGMAA